MVKEDNALGRVVISKIEATIKIKGMSEEGNGYIKIGDAIVGIDDDDTTDSDDEKRKNNKYVFNIHLP